VARRQWLGFMARESSSAPSPAPHYIDPSNGPSRQRPIKVLIFLGSIFGPHMIVSWAYHQQGGGGSNDWPPGSRQMWRLPGDLNDLGANGAGEAGEEGSHYYRIGLCSRSFIPVTFGPRTKGGFCPGSKG